MSRAERDDEASRAGPTADGRRRIGATVQRRFERVLALSRLLTLIPVVFLLIDAAGSFVYGANILIRTARGDISAPARVGGRLGVFLVVMDTFLVGATLMIAAFGFYELFVLRQERPGHAHWLPSWLRMRDVEDLKARVVSMLILVAAITFVDILVESHDVRDLLFLGTGVAAVIIALTVFLRFGRSGEAATPARASPVATSPLAAGPSEPDPLAPAGPTPAGPTPAEPASPVRAGRAPARRTLVAIAGSASLDLRAAGAPRTAGQERPAAEIKVRLIAFLGQVTVLIPPDMQVADSGLTLLGIRSVASDVAPARPGAPVLVTTGASILARVKITRASG